MAINDAIRAAMQRVHSTVGLNLRSQHPKAHGVVRATFEVLNLPEPLRVGLFQSAGNYSAWIRFSNGASFNDLRPDSHGMAIKVYGIPTSTGQTTEQDFILADCPVFFAKNAEHFLQFLKLKGHQSGELLVARTEGKSAEELIAIQKRQFGETIVPDAFPMMARFVSIPETSPLVLSYHSTTPSRFGSQAVKYAARPSDSNHTGHTLDKTENRLQNAMVLHLTQEKRSAEFTLGLIVHSSEALTPIDDATCEWKGEFVPVAKITIPPQDFLESDQVAYGERLEFSPWHALPEHEPVGSINAARRAAYEDSARTRHPNAQLVRRFYQSFAAGDYLGMQSCLHEEIEFHDLGFDLNGKALVGAMWQMLCLKPDGIRVQVRNVSADDNRGSAEWECQYSFKKDDDSPERVIHNKITASFEFKDGKIVRHDDKCDFWTWFKQAMGSKGFMAELIDKVEDHSVSVLHVEDRARAAVKAAAMKKLNAFLMLLSGQH